MKKINYLLGSMALFVLPIVAQAQISAGGDGGQLGDFLQNVLIFINEIIIPFIIGIGFLVFVWGMFQYFIAGGANEEKKEAGKSLMIWATLGFVLIIIFWGIINLVAGSIFSPEERTFDPELIPTAPVLPNAGDGPTT